MTTAGGGPRQFGRATRRAPGGVLVESEWARLREVVVGRPFLRIPRPFPPCLRRTLGAPTWDLLHRAEGRLVAEAFPQLHARVSRQMRAAARRLRDHGVVVREVPPFGPGEEPEPGRGLVVAFQYFTRDPLIVVGNLLIELEMRSPDRGRLRLPILHLLHDRPHAARMRRLIMEGVSRGNRGTRRRALLEGGDCLVTPGEVFVGISGRCSNGSGVEWLRRALAGERRVTAVKVAAKAGHLDMALCLVRPGLGIRCREWLPEGVPASLGGWTWVDVSGREALEQLAVNCLPIDARTTLVPAEAAGVARALARQGQEVVTTPFSAMVPHAGGLRCWANPLVRVD